LPQSHPNPPRLLVAVQPCSLVSLQHASTGMAQVIDGTLSSLIGRLWTLLTTSFPDDKDKAASIVEVKVLLIVGLTYCWSKGPIATTSSFPFYLLALRWKLALALVATEIFLQHIRHKALGISLIRDTLCPLALPYIWPKFDG
jgi:hypothetical protein